MEEYCCGGSLGDYLKAGSRCDENELREIAACCVRGLESFHDSLKAHQASEQDG